MARAMESTTRWDQKQAHAKPKFTQGGARPPQKKKLLLFVRSEVWTLESEPSRPDICLRRRVALLTSRSAKHDADKSKQSRLKKFDVTLRAAGQPQQ
jgi:hypothetical protein